MSKLRKVALAIQVAALTAVLVVTIAASFLKYKLWVKLNRALWTWQFKRKLTAHGMKRGDAKALAALYGEALTLFDIPFRALALKGLRGGASRSG